MNNKLRNILLALMIISFIYFEIHSCSEDGVIGPKPEVPDYHDVVYDANSVYFHDENNGWIAGQEGTVAKTTDGGASWVSSTIDSADFLDVKFVDASSGWVVGRGGVIYRSDDGGGTWTPNPFNGFPQDDDLYKVEFIDLSLGFVLGHQGVYRTEDGGSNWTNYWLPLDPCRGAWDMSVLDESNIFLLGTRWDRPDPYVLYRSNDGGLSWKSVEGTKLSELKGILTISFVDSTTGWGGGGIVLKTEDGGTNWISQIGGAEVRRFFFLDELRGFAVGNDNLIRTGDGGNTWVEVIGEDDRILDLRDVFFLNDECGWAVGRGMEEVVGGETYRHSIFMKTGDGGDTWDIRKLPWKIQ